MINRYFLHLAYKGTNYFGWQIQPNKPSIQETIQDCLAILLKENIDITGCGRTDTGVHARNFYAHFDTEKSNIINSIDIVYKLNCLLPDDIIVYGLYKMHSTAHARFDCTQRSYKYYISSVKEIFNTDFVWQYFTNLDIELMNKAAAELLKYNDFTSFSKLHSGAKTNICKISEAHWERNGSLIIFTISADRFLRNMVRSIVGTLIEVGKKKIDQKEFCTIIESLDRGKAGMSAPACGLFLETLEFPYHFG